VNAITSPVNHQQRFDLPPLEPLNAADSAHVQLNMKLGVLPLLLSLALMVGCAGEFQATGSGSSSVDVSPPDTSIQDSIDRTNQQMATDAANAAAQQQFLAGMAAAQETMNNANNNQATSNW
jgi:hypothetical protein